MDDATFLVFAQRMGMTAPFSNQDRIELYAAYGQNRLADMLAAQNKLVTAGQALQSQAFAQTQLALNMTQQLLTAAISAPATTAA
jgi:hypothetical protein